MACRWRVRQRRPVPRPQRSAAARAAGAARHSKAARCVLFSSTPRGQNEEGWNRGRYGVYHDLETWRRCVSAAGFVEQTHYYRPAGVPREQQPWLAGVWRRS